MNFTPCSIPTYHRTVFRVQPAGLDIAGHCSETSSGDEDDGCHVFLTLRDLARGVRGWMADETTPEIVTIQCETDDLQENEDYEGMTLLDSQGTIIERQTFADWDGMYEWASAYLDAHP
jgi:hypothetical protein